MKTPRSFTVTIVNPPAPEEASALVGRVAPLIGALLREAEQSLASEGQEVTAVADAATEVAAA